jgi:hypothetical protein
MLYTFELDSRLGIELPSLAVSWEEIDDSEQAYILEKWERVRGRIPDRIKELERMINSKQALLNVELDFVRSCTLNSEIAELASIITDLHLWYRSHQEVSGKPHT